MADSPARYERFVTEPHEDQRTRGQRDRDRVLYTSSFQRLAEVTQVLAPDEGHVFHNRLTHSLKVAQVARRLAEKLLIEQPAQADMVGGLDPEITEAAALAHDLGHPPFGHIAETELNHLIRESAGLDDGFEGNAQSFRIVNKLACRHRDHVGLNLTRATLNAILKYPWLRDSTDENQHKWGAYDAEQPEFDWARKFIPRTDIRKSAEAELMDWADDVTYAVHDLADFFRAGLIPLARLISSGAERKRFFDEVFQRSRTITNVYSRAQLEDAFVELVEPLPFDGQYLGTLRQRSDLRSQTGALIARYVRAVKLNTVDRTDQPRVIIESEARKEVTMLKELTWHYVILNPLLATQQFGQRKIIKTLFEIFHEAATKSKDLTIFPIAFRDQLIEADDKQAARIVADYIAGMTEHQALNLYVKLTGVTPGSALH